MSVVVKDPPEAILELYGLHDNRDANGLYVFESDSETEDGREGGGVQLLPLRNWVIEMKRYYAVERSDRFFLVWRRLQWNDHDPSPRSASEFEGLLTVLEQAQGKSYEQNRLQLAGCTVHMNQTEDLSSVFCSELVAWAYEGLGLFPKEDNASNAVPIQFSWMYRGDNISRRIAHAGHLDKDRRLKIDIP